VILPAKPGPKEELPAPNLIASLVLAERKASVWKVEFSSNGARLFTAGYPSGIVQIWDVAARKELCRIDTPPGLRGSADYALLTPDWKTLYVPVERRTWKAFERDGERLLRVEYAGAVLIWDVPSGKSKPPLEPAAGMGPVWASLSPDGRLLLSVERAGYDSSNPRVKDVTVVWDLAAGTRRKLCDGYAIPKIAPDGKTAVVNQNDYEAKTSCVKVLDLATGKELAKVSCPEKVRFFSLGSVAPDGSVVAVHLGGSKGAPMEISFFDAKTLAARGKLLGQGDPKGHGWGGGQFTPDGKRYAAVDGKGNALVWNVAEEKLERTLPVGSHRPAGMLAISPDGRTLAVAWAPKSDPDLEETRDPDPRDLPQPRVSLVDLSGKSRPRVLVAPHGYPGALAFSPDGTTLAFGGAGAVHLFDLSR
jgi:hypothetical protein